jgi:hypothetical protein
MNAPPMETTVPNILATLLVLLKDTLSILKRTASKKVNAGVRLLIAEASVGEL